ncbi:cytochrome P450 [Lyophyllum atratum]|nr:cytochrome P450 [Lyophyllum atratum]
MILKALLTASALFLVSRALSFFNALKKLDYLPGYRPLFAPLSLLGAVIPTTWWHPGLNWSWLQRRTAYFDHNHDVISIVPVLSGPSMYYTASLDVMRQVLSAEGKTHLIKPRDLTSVLLLWGDNLISANGEMWKRHRRHVGPAFTAKTYSLVWAETVATYNEMVSAQGWDRGKEFLVRDINGLSAKLALIIISRCGFGLPMSWADVDDKEGSLSFGQSLTIVARTSILRLVIPLWVYKLPIQRLRHINNAWVTLARFMQEFVQRRKQEVKDIGTPEGGDRGDVFTRLVAAAQGGDKYGLEEQEVIGNTFALMFAGHETTAHVLSATLGFLAIYQEDQEKAYQEVLSLCPAGSDPNLEDAYKLKHFLACFQESLRLYPAGAILTREFTEDVAVRTTHPSEQTLVFHQGTRVIIDMIGVHHNPRLYPEPERFMPSRWYGAPEDVSMFGIGPRGCIGRKFAQTEALCFLSLILRDWKLDIVLQDGETREEYEDRVMGKAKMVGLAFGVGPIALRLVRRE